MATVVDTGELQKKIDKNMKKKQDAIDLMLEGIISKDDLKTQVDLYDKEIEQLTLQISQSKNISDIQQKQLDSIRKYIEQINQTEHIDTTQTNVYRSMLNKVIYYGNGRMDVYLNCVPFGFQVMYRKDKIPHSHYCRFVVESCSIIE